MRKLMAKTRAGYESYGGCSFIRAMTFTAIVLLAARTDAAVLFSENFESDLSQWTGKNGGSSSAEIVTDPLDPTNHVLTFSGLAEGGDLFTATALALQPGQTYVFSFDYLGISPYGAGFAGLCDGLSADVGPWYWAFGTAGYADGFGPIAVPLVSDGAWANYSWTFTFPIGSLSSPVHLMFEDYVFDTSVPGDAYFDNVELATVPEPASSSLFLGALAYLLTRRHRRVAV